MNLNDINKRLERIYISMGDIIDNDLMNHVQVAVHKDSKKILGMMVVAQPEKDTEHKIYTVIHNIASLKDHLKQKYDNVEDQINKSLELQLIIDIDNSDKHGYPAEIRPRSNLFPKITNIDRNIRVNIGDKFSCSSTYKFGAFDEESQEFDIKETHEIKRWDGTIFIDADIVDKDGNFIMKFEKMISESLKKWEGIINL